MAPTAKGDGAGGLAGLELEAARFGPTIFEQQLVVRSLPFVDVNRKAVGAPTIHLLKLKTQQKKECQKGEQNIDTTTKPNEQDSGVIFDSENGSSRGNLSRRG
jgi:hypothetical protein